MAQEATASAKTSRTDDNEREFVLRFKMPDVNNILTFWLPDDTQQHIRNAQKENLLVLRSILDAAIERIEESGSDSGRRSSRIDID